MISINLDLKDSEATYRGTSNSQLVRKYWLFWIFGRKRLKDFASRVATTAMQARSGIKKWFVKGRIRSTIFKQFCGGETISECDPRISQLGERKIGTILDYSAEGSASEQTYEMTKDEIILTVKKGSGNDLMPFSVFKVSGIADPDVLAKAATGETLSPEEKTAWRNARARVDEICGVAASLDQSILIDAEHSWIQDAIDQVAGDMMRKYNQHRPIVFNTVQLYRTGRLDFLKNAHRDAQTAGYLLGVKIVRGAYMEIERERAQKMNYPSPIHPDQDSTDRDFNAALQYCLEHIDDIGLFVGSHNLESIQHLTDLMAEKNISADNKNIFVAQLLGMGDNLSFILAEKGYNVSKYVPYGPVDVVTPYLVRRANENSSTETQMGRELELLDSEMKRRNIGTIKRLVYLIEFLFRGI